MLGHPLCAPLRVLLTWLQAVEMFLCVKGGWLPELSLQPQNSHPTFCLGPPQWPTPSNRAPEAHRPTTIEPVCLWVLNETNSQSLRPNTPLSWFSDTHWGTIWILTLNISLPLDFFAWTSCLGLRLWIQLGTPLSKHCDMLSFSRDPLSRATTPRGNCELFPSRRQPSWLQVGLHRLSKAAS